MQLTPAQTLALISALLGNQATPSAPSTPQRRLVQTDEEKLAQIDIKVGEEVCIAGEAFRIERFLGNRFWPTDPSLINTEQGLQENWLKVTPEVQITAAFTRTDETVPYCDFIDGSGTTRRAQPDAEPITFWADPRCVGLNCAGNVVITQDDGGATRLWPGGFSLTCPPRGTVSIQVTSGGAV